MIDKFLYILIIVVIIILIKVVLDERNTKPGITKIINNSNKGMTREHKRVYDILEAPERKYLPETSYSQDDFNYSLMGYVSRSEDDPNYNPNLTSTNRLKLFGRKDVNNRRLYNYYVVENGVKIPLDNNKEIYDDEQIKIDKLSGNFDVNLYDTEQTFNYNPFSF